ELCEQIRGLNPAQDIIVVTGSDDVRTAVRAMRLGVYDYLVKPIEREELMLVIDRLQERATLYDEHARLVHENVEYAEMQQTFSKAMRVMQSLDFETVCERLLSTLADVCAAQGAILWLAREDREELNMHGYRGLVEPGMMPASWALSGSELSEAVRAGVPVFVERDLSSPTAVRPPGPSMLVPLSRDSRLLGLVQLVDKLGGGFDMRDAERAKAIAEAATTAISHARRFRQLERVGLRDTNTSAYNMTYFVDYLGRELHKARRYKRSFSLIQVSIDNVASLREALKPEVFKEAMRRLVQAIAGPLTDIDVLARVTDSEMYLLLPETDFLHGLNFARTAREAIARSPFLADIDRMNPIQVSFGPAAFPRDGDDVDQLFNACKRRLEEARRSLFRRLHLEDVDFWGAVELLIGDRGNYDGDSVQLDKALEVTEDHRGLSRHAIFPVESLDSLRREVLGEALRQGRASGWLYLGGAWGAVSREVLSGLQQIGERSLKTYVLGHDVAEKVRGSGQLTPVRTDADSFQEREVILMLCEHSAYALLAQRRHDGRL
ncbi:MAG: diguanylate cyclase, partial [Myxococcota bacterium]